MALRTSLEEKEALLKEVHHRVKNNLQIISSLLHLHSLRERQEGVLAALRDTQARIKAMALLHDALYRSDNLAQIDFGPYVKSLCAQLSRSYAPRGGTVRVEVQVPELHLDLERAVPCGLIISELVTNAFKHAFPGKQTGRIVISVERFASNDIGLCVVDDGIGLSKEFDLARASSLGLQLVERLAGQLGGTLHVHCDGGTHLCIRFPMHPELTASPDSGDKETLRLDT
jgi:two-component sensor histidine kinase